MFNDSYDTVILPYNHRHQIEKLYNEVFNAEFLDLDLKETCRPFQSEGIIYQFNHNKHDWSKKIQWECMSDTKMLVTCSVRSEYLEYPSITLYEQHSPDEPIFPMKSHKISISEFWFTFDLSDRSMTDFQAQLDLNGESREFTKSYLTSSVMRDIMDKCIYDNKFEIECINVLMFVFWYSNRLPECVEHDNSRDQHRSKREIKEIKNHHGKVDRNIPLVRRTFVVRCNTSDAQKIRRSEPDHKVYVRGHYRRYKDGKQIYIKPFTKYNDKPDTHNKTYII